MPFDDGNKMASVNWRDVLQQPINHRWTVEPPYEDLRIPDQSSNCWISRPGGSTSMRTASRTSRPTNDFISRNNPHPMRVRHFKGFLDVPLCGVFDYYPPPRTSALIDSKLIRPQRHSVTALATNPKMMKPNTGVIFADWRHELHALTAALGLLPLSVNDGSPGLTILGGELRQQSNNRQLPTDLSNVCVSVRRASLSSDALPVSRRSLSTSRSRSAQRPITGGRCGTARIDMNSFHQHSSELHLPSTLSLSSRSTRRSTRTSSSRNSSIAHENIAETEAEQMVLQLLCQLLNVDDVGTAHAWLLTASDTDKALVMELIRTALTSKEATSSDELRNDRPVLPRTPYGAERNTSPLTDLPNGEVFDRLTLESSSSRPSASAALHVLISDSFVASKVGDTRTETEGYLCQGEMQPQYPPQFTSKTTGDNDVEVNHDRTIVDGTTALPGNTCDVTVLKRPDGTSDARQSDVRALYHQRQQPKMRYVQTPVSTTSRTAAAI